MLIYLRKLTSNDTKKQIETTTEAYVTFFNGNVDNQNGVTVNIENRGHTQTAEFTILKAAGNANSYRFSSKSENITLAKFIIQNENGFDEGDILKVERNKGKYTLFLIHKDDEDYSSLQNMIISKQNTVMVLDEFDEDDDIVGFVQWMKEYKQLSDKSISHYEKSVINVSADMFNSGVIDNLLQKQSYVEVIQSLAKINASPSFIDKNKNGHNMYSCGLNWYKDYRKWKNNNDNSPLKGTNKIIFGAPGTGKSYKLEHEKRELLDHGGTCERVTFHPDYSYANFVGTYKPVMMKKTAEISGDSDLKEVLAVLKDNSKSAQEKYDILYDRFKNKNLTCLPLLLGICSDEDFKTRKVDGSSTANDNSVSKNHGKAIRQFVNIMSDEIIESKISYEYVPGPFMRTLVASLKSGMTDSPKPSLLIIEEINRANVAAVFGDVFQLLDRNSDGESEFKIATSYDMRSYLAKELDVSEAEVDTISIPNNMFIWATMNSADQGVYPMDTAFKRRWTFEYINIDDGQDEIKDLVIPIQIDQGIYACKWNDIRKALNTRLLEVGKVNEDKLLGPFFIAKASLDNISKTLNARIALADKSDAEKTEEDIKTQIKYDNEIENFIKGFESKVIMYLFEDVMKMHPGKLFVENAQNTRLTYSGVCTKFREIGLKIFGIDDKVIMEGKSYQITSDNKAE